MPATIRIATRKSPLALWQAHFVKEQLLHNHPGLNIELVKMVTRGDKILDSPLAKIGGKGLFVKELEEGMLAGVADIAVHSMKDVPMDLPEGFELAVICERETPLDAFVSNHFASLDVLPEGAKVGTSSLRRASQLLHRRPDLKISSLRGNVQTRLSKLDDGDFDAIILAAAGLLRLEMASRIRQRIAAKTMLPAVGQGAVGIECRADDTEIKALLACLDHAPTHLRVSAERAFNHRLEGGCQVPIAGYAVIEDKNLWMRGLVASPDGKELLYAESRGDKSQGETMGLLLAEDLLDQGAGSILGKIAL